MIDFADMMLTLLEQLVTIHQQSELAIILER